MRRVVLYGIGWLAAATAAMLLAWQGVGRVGTHVTDGHAAPLTAEQARRQLERVTATGGDPGQPGGEPAGGAGTTAPGSGTGPGPTGGGGGGGPTTTTTRPTTPGSAPTASTSPTTATTGPGLSTTAPPSGATETRTYTLVGGSTTLRFGPSGVTVVVANPHQGFSVDVDDSGGGRVRVRFESDSHRSQVEGWWDGGPRDEVREEADDDDGDDGD